MNQIRRIFSFTQFLAFLPVPNDILVEFFFIILPTFYYFFIFRKINRVLAAIILSGRVFLFMGEMTKWRLGGWVKRPSVLRKCTEEAHTVKAAKGTNGHDQEHSQIEVKGLVTHFLIEGKWILYVILYMHLFVFT